MFRAHDLISRSPSTEGGRGIDRRLCGSWLLQRVFAVDVLKCEKCGGRLRVVEIAKKPDDVSRVLAERGWSRAPPRGPPRAEVPLLAHGQLRLAFQ